MKKGISITLRITGILKSIDWVLLSLILASVLLRAVIPPYIIYNSPHDDLLGVQIARSLINGDWLGIWNINTLAKPSGYAIFLWIAHSLHISPTLLTHLLYLSFSLLFSQFLSIIAFRKKQQNSENHIKNFTRIVFAIMAFNPVVFGGHFSRVYRTSLYSVLVLLFFTLLLKTLHVIIQEFTNNQKKIEFARQRIILVFFMGLTYSVLQSIRAESFWILYALIVTSLPFVFFGAISNVRTRNIKKFCGVGLSLVICFAVPATILKLGTETANWKAYGVAETENFFNGSFADAYKRWSGVRNGVDPRSYVTISKGQREAVYNVSPAAKKLSQFLEIPDGAGWKVHSCKMIGLCDDYGGAWLPWAIRDAAIASGQVNDERSFQQYFKEISTQIEVACQSNKLSCGDSGFQVAVKPLNQISKRYVANSVFESTSQLLRMSPVENLDRPIINQDARIFQTWSEVLKVRYEPTNSSNQWISLPGVVELLKYVYQPFVLITSVFLMIFFGFKWKTSNPTPLKIYAIYLVIAIFTYLVGLGITEASYGFGSFKNSQLITVQPLFLMALLTCCVGLYSNLKNND